jgi:hypothetical protein
VRCPLCKRKGAPLSKHHLVPKARGGSGGDVERVCEDCHRAIHKFFPLKDLERDLNSVEALMANERFCLMVEWIGKQGVGKRLTIERPRDQRGRGKYR